MRQEIEIRVVAQEVSEWCSIACSMGRVLVGENREPGPTRQRRTELKAAYASEGELAFQAALFWRISRSNRAASSFFAFSRLRIREGLSLLAEWLM